MQGRLNPILFAAFFLLAASAEATAQPFHVANLEGDDTDAIQAAIGEHGGKREIQLAAGTWTISRTLLYASDGIAPGLRLSGAGSRSTVIHSRVGGGPGIFLNAGTDDFTRQEGGCLRDFTLLADLPPAGPNEPADTGHGIHVHKNWFLELDNLIVGKFSEDGIHFSGGSDAHSTNNVTITRCQVTACRGYGLRCFLFGGPAGFTSFHVMHCRFGQNLLGGARLPSHDARVEDSVFFRNFGEGGLIIPSGDGDGTHVTRRAALISGCAFDTNFPAHIVVEAGIGVEITSNHFVAQGAGQLPTIGVRLGNPAGSPYLGVLTGAVCSRNQVRNTPVDHVQTAFLIEHTCRGVEAGQNYFGNFSEAAGAVKYVDRGTGTVLSP